MIFRESMLRAIEVLAIVAPEWKVNFDSACFTFHTLRLPDGWNTSLLLTFNLGTLHYLLGWLMSPKCATCGREFAKLEKCQFCGKLYCKEDYTLHMAWERRHEGMAEEEGKMWRKRRDAPE